MKSFLIFLLKLIFILGLPIALLLALPRLNNYSTKVLESRLVEQNFYGQLSSGIIEQLNQSDANSSISGLGSFATTELTPAYLQSKTETTLDQISAWATGKSATVPSISFNDLQTKLMAENPEVKAQIDQALAEIKSQNLTVPDNGIDTESQESLKQLLEKSGNLDNLTNGNWSLSLEQPLAGLPRLMQWYTIGLPVIASLLLLSLISIILLSPTLAAKCKAAGWTLLITGLWNAMVAGVFYILAMSALVANFIPSGQLGDTARALLKAVQLSLLDNFTLIEGILTAVLIGLGILLLIIGYNLHKKGQPVAVDDQGQGSKWTEATTPEAPAQSATEALSKPA